MYREKHQKRPRFSGTINSIRTFILTNPGTKTNQIPIKTISSIKAKKTVLIIISILKMTIKSETSVEYSNHIYQPLRLGRIWHKVNFFKRSLTGLNSEFSFSKTSCLTKAEEPSLPYYLPITGGRIFGFIPFPRVLVLCEMLSVRYRIWTRVAVSIPCDDNHYTTGRV